MKVKKNLLLLSIGAIILIVVILGVTYAYFMSKNYSNNSFSTNTTFGNFAEYIMNLYTSDGENDLYYHDGVGDYDNARYEAGDNSYRYAGADPNNYVCFGSTAETCPTDNLYRIIGLFDDDGDGTYNIKLIKADYATVEQLGDDGDYNGLYSSSSFDDSYYQGSNYSNIASYYWNRVNRSDTYDNEEAYDIWSYSALNNDNLNGDFITYIGNEWSSLIAYHNWQVGGMTYTIGLSNNAQTVYNYEVGDYSSNITHSAKIGLMYVSDYYYGASPTYWVYPGFVFRDGFAFRDGEDSDYRAATSDNWMYMGAYEWTISSNSDSTDIVLIVNGSGDVNLGFIYVFSIAVRPTFYLESSVEITGGIGTKENPYRILV